jgi:hypothetical protein
MVLEGVKAMPDVDVLLSQIARAKGAAAMIDTAIRKRFELMVAELQRGLAAIEQHPVSQRDSDKNWGGRLRGLGRTAGSQSANGSFAEMPDNRQTGATELRGLTFFDDLPEVRCQLAIVMGKHLIQVPLGPDRRLQSPLFTLGGFGLVLLYFRVKISHYSATPRNTRTTFDSTLACAEKKATLREIFAAYDWQ